MRAESQAAALPFLIVASIAILAGGVIAAAIAHAPTQPLVWMVAYLVLVVGLAQAAFGAGQSLLATQPLPTRFVAIECVLFNVGNVGVIAGTLIAWFPLVAAGTALFVISLGMFLYGVRASHAKWLAHAFRALLAVLAISAMIGLALSITKGGS